MCSVKHLTSDPWLGWSLAQGLENKPERASFKRVKLPSPFHQCPCLLPCNREFFSPSQCFLWGGGKPVMRFPASLFLLLGKMDLLQW